MRVFPGLARGLHARRKTAPPSGG